MEILVSAGMIIFAIAFFYVYFLASAILFCDAPVSLIGALFSFRCGLFRTECRKGESGSRI